MLKVKAGKTAHAFIDSSVIAGRGFNTFARDTRRTAMQMGKTTHADGSKAESIERGKARVVSAGATHAKAARYKGMRKLY